PEHKGWLWTDQNNVQHSYNDQGIEIPIKKPVPVADGTNGTGSQAAQQDGQVNVGDKPKVDLTTPEGVAAAILDTMKQAYEIFANDKTGFASLAQNFVTLIANVYNAFQDAAKASLEAVKITIPPTEIKIGGNTVTTEAKSIKIIVPDLKSFAGSPTTKAFGGFISYTGSREAAPGFQGMSMGGMARKRYAFGSIVPGFGSTDIVPALLTPGEFVINKGVAKELGPILSAVNSNVFPSLELGGPRVKPNAPTSSNQVQYMYNLDINVAGSNSSPDDIANAVIGKIKMIEDRNIRGVRVGNS
ncbi:MAG: hypothetical protein EB127_29035, partial [Alphaproteobacteria bacterium]|nr:hypothetical protein [Alphaproteobacteria bacterium]